MSEAKARQVPHGNLIADAIRTSIISGELVPGDRVLEDRYAEKFGVSRVPVREAIRRLDAEGYVTVTLNAGARVVVPAKDDARDLLQVRSPLEVLAARLAAERRGGGCLDQLAALLDAGERSIQDGDFTKVSALASDFHGLVIEASGNAQLVRMLNDVRAKLAWIWAIDVEAQAPTSWEAHAAIFQAISAADAPRAAELMSAHMIADETKEGPDTAC
jgi:DNA-binding GntR family transcriptional regulator